MLITQHSILICKIGIAIVPISMLIARQSTSEMVDIHLTGKEKVSSTIKVKVTHF